MKALSKTIARIGNKTIAVDVIPIKAIVHANKKIQSLKLGFIKNEIENAAKIGTPIVEKNNLPKWASQRAAIAKVRGPSMDTNNAARAANVPVKAVCGCREKRLVSKK